MKKGKFIILNWWEKDGTDAILIIVPTIGINKIFSTREEAEEYCNTELDGFYKVIDLEE